MDTVLGDLYPVERLLHEHVAAGRADVLRDRRADAVRLVAVEERRLAAVGFVDETVHAVNMTVIDMRSGSVKSSALAIACAQTSES